VTKAQVGDIVEFETPKGFAYAQFSNVHERFGELLRVLPGIYQTRREEFADLAQQNERFYVFYPLKAMIKEGLVKVVAHSDVPVQAKPFPLFKAAGWRDPQSGRVQDWWLWDGHREWRVGSLTEDLAALPIRAITGHDLLVRRIADGWHPRDVT